MISRLGLLLDSFLVEVLLYIGIFLLDLRLFYQQLFVPSDMQGHLRLVYDYVYNGSYVPHPLFHIIAFAGHWVSGLPLVFVVPLLLSALSVLTILLTKRLLKYYRPGFQLELVYVLSAVAVNCAIAIYVPWYNALPYLGQWSPNIWHSPTMILLKPLALLGFCGAVHYASGPAVGRRLIAWLTSAALALGTIAKPSFIICFLPALALFLLVFHWKNLRLYRDTFLMFLPSLLLLSRQFIAVYTSHARPSQYRDHIILSSFAATRFYAPSALVSTLLVGAFPMSVFLAIRGRAIRNSPLIASWFLVVVGFLQASFVSEENKVSHGNFVSGYVISLFIVFFFSLVEFLSWFTPGKEPAVSFKWKAVVAVLAAAHLASGFWYYGDLVAGNRIF